MKGSSDRFGAALGAALAREDASWRELEAERMSGALKGFGPDWREAALRFGIPCANLERLGWTTEDLQRLYRLVRHLCLVETGARQTVERVSADGRWLTLALVVRVQGTAAGTVGQQPGSTVTVRQRIPATWTAALSWLRGECQGV